MSKAMAIFARVVLCIYLGPSDTAGADRDNPANFVKLLQAYVLNAKLLQRNPLFVHAVQPFAETSKRAQRTELR